jgi:hypothetical protein
MQLGSTLPVRVWCWLWIPVVAGLGLQVPSQLLSAPTPTRCAQWDFFTLTVTVQASPFWTNSSTPASGRVPARAAFFVNFTAVVVLPTREVRVVPGFYDGVLAGRHTFRARVYCGWVGQYSLRTTSRVSDIEGVEASCVSLTAHDARHSAYDARHSAAMHERHDLPPFGG